MASQKGFSAGMIQPADTLQGGLLIPTSVVQADNNHGFDINQANVSGRKMDISRRQRTATMTNSVILDRDKTVFHLGHPNSLDLHLRYGQDIWRSSEYGCLMWRIHKWTHNE